MTFKNQALNADHYKQTRLPLLEADTMPTECYTSRDFYDQELKKIFYRVKIFILYLGQ